MEEHIIKHSSKFGEKENVTPIERGLELIDEKKLQPKEKDIEANMKMLGAMKDVIEKELDELSAKGGNMDGKDMLERNLKRLGQDIASLEKEQDKILDERATLVERADMFEKRRMKEQ